MASRHFSEGSAYSQNDPFMAGPTDDGTTNMTLGTPAANITPTASPTGTRVGAGAAGAAPLLPASRNSGRSGPTATSRTSKSSVPWMFRTGTIIAVLVALLILLALGLGLGLGLGLKNNNNKNALASSGADGAGSQGNGNGNGTVSSDVTVGGSTTFVPQIVTATGSDVVQTSVILQTGGTTTVLVSGATAAPAVTQVTIVTSEVPSTSTIVTTATVFSETSTITEGGAGGTLTVIQTIVSTRTARKRRILDAAALGPADVPSPFPTVKP